MKTALISIATAILLGLGSYAANRPLDLADYAVILSVTSIVVWTIEQYRHRGLDGL